MAVSACVSHLLLFLSGAEDQYRLRRRNSFDNASNRQAARPRPVDENAQAVVGGRRLVHAFDVDFRNDVAHVCRWKTLFMIFQSPSTLSSVNRSVNR